MIITTHSATLHGLNANLVTVEADSVRGKPGLTVIGLPEKAVEEAKERLTSALANCQVRLKCKKTVVNLAPADLRKTGSNLELALAVALWELTIEKSLTTTTDIFFGELALDGSLRRIRGCLPLVSFAKDQGFKRVFVPAANLAEVQVLAGVEIYPLTHLSELLSFYQGKTQLQPVPPTNFRPELTPATVDFSTIIGQAPAKRCLEIAAAGGHNLLLTGVPGAGKSLLAAALPSILPPLTRQEALELTTIHSVSGLTHTSGLITARPCRSPHHTISAIGLVGGGSNLLPGEISLAHHGVLFLDELGEFRRDALEVLRQPLETGTIAISRATGKVEYPARVTLVAATNPCPCGYLGSKKRDCTCSPTEIARYRQKLSGPILDRLDMHIFVPEVEVAQLTNATTHAGETSTQIRARVIRARKRQQQRSLTTGVLTNAALSSAQIRSHLLLTEDSQHFLAKAMQRLQFSARTYFKLIKVAQTINDLTDQPTPALTVEHLAEALQYRRERT